MNQKIKDAIPVIISRISKVQETPKSAFLGFDACIDSIVKIVREKNGGEITSFFSDSDQFGKFLVNLGNKSCGLELQTKLSKIGGNMVISSNALGNLGVKADCVGTFGYPEILPVFHSMSPNCTLHTIADTINATALEFDNSKVIMFDPGPYNNLTWDGITSIISPENLRKLIEGKQLIALVNWSEIDNSSQLWNGILTDILPSLEDSSEKTHFFSDLSDCSRKSKAEIREAIDLLGQFRKKYKVTLSLNQNEAELVANALEISPDVPDRTFIKNLFDKMNLDILVIHRVRDALVYDGEKYEFCDTFLCKEPKVLTGGGDNFNAGFCYALLCDLDLFQSLVVANAVSGSYVKNGTSPDLNALEEFIVNYQ